jgi:hypothetical protein
MYIICGNIRKFNEALYETFQRILINTISIFSDLESRKITREQAWQVDGWADTVFKTGI